MNTDIEIAQQATLAPIVEVAADLGLDADDIDLYGKYKAMPGLPKHPTAENIDLVNGKVVGLF